MFVSSDRAKCLAGIETPMPNDPYHIKWAWPIASFGLFRGILDFSVFQEDFLRGLGVTSEAKSALSPTLGTDPLARAYHIRVHIWWTSGEVCQALWSRPMSEPCRS